MQFGLCESQKVVQLLAFSALSRGNFVGVWRVPGVPGKETL